LVCDGLTIAKENIFGKFVFLFVAIVIESRQQIIIPAIPAVNLAWNTKNLNSGILSVVSLPTAPLKFESMAVSGNNFIFSRTNGVPDWPYYVLASTNLSLSSAGCTIVLSNRFDDNGRFSFTNPVDADNLQQFYLLRLP